MTQFKSVLLVLFGLSLWLCGLVHSINTYPGQIVLDRLMSSLPTLAAVLAFAIGVAVSVGGFILLIVATRSFHRRSNARYMSQARRLVPTAQPSGYESQGYDSRRLGRPSFNGTEDREDESEWAGAYR